MAAYAYLLRCSDGSLYAGACRDIDERLALHNAGKASKYTRSRLPVRVAYVETCDTWSAALRREAALKRLGKPQKEKLASAPH